MNARPANDDSLHLHHQPDFIGSRYFWAALASSIVFCLIFAALMGFGSGSAIAALFRSPAQYSPFIASMAAIAAIQWLFALSAYRQSVNNVIWRRMMMVTQQLREPSPLAEEAGSKIIASFDRLFADIEERLEMLDEKTGQLSSQVNSSLLVSSEATDISISNIRSVIEESSVQREALQRTSVMISTEILPVISKLETTMHSLEAISQNAGSVLETVGDRLQQSTRELKSCLDDFNRANHTVAPEIEKRMLKFETSISRLPEQLDATIGRLSPMSETIADAAMLSAANIEVIDQLARDIATSLASSRNIVTDISDTSMQMFREAADTHAGRFRETLQAIVSEEADRVSFLSRELGNLAETASSVVSRLHQPVAEVASAANSALSNMHASITALDERIQANLGGCLAELNDAASRLASQVTREIEASTATMQARLSASSNELVQRVGNDTARFENLIGETADRTSSRIASVVKDLPSLIAQRMETEIAKVDGSLKVSVVGLSDQMRQIIDSIPGRLSDMTRATLDSLEENLERSFDGVAQRSEWLNERFRQNATETTEGVLQSYVDFIFLTVDRFRREMEDVNASFSKDFETTIKSLPLAGTTTSLEAPEDQSPEGSLDYQSDFDVPAPEGTVTR